MRLVVANCAYLIVVLGGLAMAALGSELREGTLTSDLVPSPVKYAVLLPDGYEQSTKTFPLLLWLHGGRSNHEELRLYWKQILDELWAERALSKMVVAMPGTGTPTLEGRSEYVDFHDGSEKWHSFVIGPFLSHIREQYRVSKERAHTAIGGFSMGGLGALRFAFKHPDKFSAVAGWEPSVLPAYRWKDVKARNRFHYSDEFLEKLFGKPLQDSWEVNNPALIVRSQAEAIRKSGLQVYIECGDEDYLNLHEGTEFLHRALWDSHIPHEYHSVRGADHIGRTTARRAREGLQFLDRALHPLGEDRDPVLLEMKEFFRGQKMKAERESKGGVPTAP